MKKYYFPDKSEILKKKPANSTWISINLNLSTLNEKMQESGIETIKEYLVFLYMDFLLEEKRNDRLEIKVRNYLIKECYLHRQDCLCWRPSPGLANSAENTLGEVRTEP